MDVEELLNLQPTLLAYIDQQQVIRYANARYAQLHGLSAEGVAGKKLAELLGSTYSKIEPHVSAALEGERRQFHMSFPLTNGARTLHADFTPRVSLSGRITGFVACLWEQKEHDEVDLAPANLLLALDQGQEGLAIHDADEKFTYVNRASAQMYGFTPEELIGRSWRLLYGPEETTRIEEVIFPRLRSQGQWQGLLKGRRKEGDAFDVEVSLKLLRDANGNPNGLICNCRDGTEQKATEEWIQRLERQEALGQLTSGIAHDFNNLLAIVIGNLELTNVNNPLDPETTELLRIAVDAAHKGSALTGRLLALTRHHPTSPAPVDVCHLLHDMKDLLNRSLGQQILLNVAYEESLWPCRVDASQLENAILNLVINARDAMTDEGEIVIEASNAPRCRIGDQEVDAVRISVTDNGEGMDPSVREQATAPFFTTKPPGKGTGLGLSMVHKFTTQSEGKLTIETTPGEGTRVHMLLPRSAGETPDEVSPAQDCPQGDGEPSWSSTTI